MKKLTLFILCTIALPTILFAQESDSVKYWKNSAVGTLTFTQVSLTNWAGGGDNSIALNGYVGLSANYKKKRTTWENGVDLAYGLLKQGDEQLRKSDDKINFVSKFCFCLINEIIT